MTASVTPNETVAASTCVSASDHALPLGRLDQAYERVRTFSERLCEPLEVEDFVVQSMPDASPTKWHLAHTTWFFETFVLIPARVGYEPFDGDFSFLFNSYYNAVGDRHARPRRGLLSRPTVARVMAHRRHVDRAMMALLAEGREGPLDPAVVEVGLHHEQQHQELMLTDLKHLFSVNPLRPAYGGQGPSGASRSTPLEWVATGEGIHEIGHAGDGFCFDNETPRHRVFLNAFELATRLVTNAEYRAFIEDGGYERAELWLSEGWDHIRQHGWKAPLYWEQRDSEWWTYTLGGMRPVVEAQPICHVSYYEADAYARWAGARLPSEAEWEVAAAGQDIAGHFVESGRIHPEPARESAGLQQLFGDVWEWTHSPYVGYPGYRPLEGALGEYNGKFMCNQLVLRGGSCATSASHIRATYRNFFPAHARWQFMGLRLARDT